MKNKQILGIVVAGVVFIAVCVTGVMSNALVSKMTTAAPAVEKSSTFSSIMSEFDSETVSLPENDFIGVVNIVGTIQSSDSSTSFTSSGQYNHSLYMEYIDQMMEADNNKGILLYVNSPGGTVYESDEMYLKLMEYKEVTGRPIYAYFASEACSGGYYISMAADKIYANRNTWTGSIGVIVSLTNCKKLYDKIGLKEIDITSGKNKSMGSAALNLTDEQYDILQSLVDEAYDQFTSIVEEGRHLGIDKVKKLADGRIYSAKQAKENGLVDEIGSLEDLKEAMETDNSIDSSIEYFEPENDMSNLFNMLFSKAESLIPKSDSELAVDIIENQGNGVLMYYAD